MSRLNEIVFNLFGLVVTGMMGYLAWITIAQLLAMRFPA